MNFFSNFDVETGVIEGGFSPIPAGEYIGAIESIDEKETKAGGLMLVFRWKVLEGRYKERLIFQNCNVVNANPKAEEIGKRMVGTICKALEVSNPDPNGFNLLNKPAKIKVKVNPAQNGYEASNDISYVSSTKEVKKEGVKKAATPWG